jgi:hypothetical protein
MRGHLSTIETVTGHAPGTCPWRSFTVPIVREVLSVTWALRSSNLSAATGTDPPHKLAQAIGVYDRAYQATKADEERLLHEERAAKRRAEAALRKAESRGR